MKTNNWRVECLVAVLGVGVVVAVLIGVRSYVRVEREARATEALTATLDQLYHDQSLSLAIRRIHEGDAAGASRQMDLLLCDDILLLKAQLGSADERTRTLVADGFRRIGRVRPRTEPAVSTAAGYEGSEDQVAAQRILELATTDRIVAQSTKPRM
jgi:hypothetical protein